MIKQFLPQEFCLKCRGCCRFSQEDSVWAPCLLEEEIQDLLDREGLPPASISIERRIHLLPNPEGSGFICPFLNIQDNRCKIYDLRPFECQLYPFLINLRGKRVLLTVDPNCPYIKDNLKSKDLKEHTNYLATFLNTPAQIKILKDNPQIIQAYEDVSDTAELNILDETE